MASDEQKIRILALMGSTLILLQATEKLISLCMTFVFQKGGPLTIEDLEKQRKDERKSTLGYFLTELRKRAELHIGFDEMLADYLERRNIFVHRVEDVPGWNLDSVEGRMIAEKFVTHLFELTIKMLQIFAGFLRAWEKQTGLDIPKPLDSEEFFAEVDRIYTPLIDHLVFKKEV